MSGAQPEHTLGTTGTESEEKAPPPRTATTLALAHNYADKKLHRHPEFHQASDELRVAIFRKGVSRMALFFGPDEDTEDEAPGDASLEAMAEDEEKTDQADTAMEEGNEGTV